MPDGDVSAGRVRTIAVVSAPAIVAAVTLWASRWMGGSPTGGDDLYARGDWAGAERAARSALKDRPDHPDALRLLARSSARLGRDELTLSLYARRNVAERMEAEDHALVGISLYRRKRPEAAAEAVDKAMNAGPIAPATLEELARVQIAAHRLEEAARAAGQVAREPGWEARGSMILGTVRAGLDDIPGAAEAFRVAIDRDPGEIDHSADPVGLGKLVARTFLRAGRATEARAVLVSIIAHRADPEVSWLLSRAYLLEGDRERSREALARSGDYRAQHPMDPEPGPFVGEARCEPCHARIYRESLASRHTQTYFRGDQLDTLPRPDRPLPDPDVPAVTHAIVHKGGRLREETRVGDRVLETVIEYAFGTPDRYLTMVGRDGTGVYRTARLSYHQTDEGRGWARSALVHGQPARAEDYQGQAIGVRDGVAKCLYCHATNPRSGLGATGPEASDRAIGCERCHGPGGNHLAAVAAGFPDPAIAGPAAADARVVSERQCNDCHILGRDFRRESLRDPAWARSQGVGWLFSRCNTESGGAFGCVTCHDPHRPAASTRPAQYEAKCLACHAAADRGRRACPVNPSAGCVGCHMPRVRLESLGMSVTDHYIQIRGRVAAGGESGQPGASRRPDPARSTRETSYHP